MPTDPNCPRCGKTMKLRNGRNGDFWGCKGYPACKGTLPMNGEARHDFPFTSEADANRNLDAQIFRADPDQARLIAWRPTDGDKRVSATAGSGKTTAVVALVAKLIRDGVSPATIVLATFTAKAGAEMTERAARLIPGDKFAKIGHIGTFHKLALRALRNLNATRWDIGNCLDLSDRARGLPHAKQLWNKVFWKGAIKGTNVDGLDLDLDELGVKAGDYALAVGVMRAHGMTVTDPRARELARTEYEHLKFIGAAWEAYEAAKLALGAFDFADAIAAYRDGLVAGTIFDAAGVVIVDECQDNDWMQGEISRLLARNGKRLRVGDGRQSIYSFRGAYPLGFLTVADGEETIEFPRNYRSARKIVAIGNDTARGADWSVGADAIAVRDLDGSVRTLAGSDPAHEARMVAQEIAAAIGAGASPSDFAILARTNAATAMFEAACMREKVPAALLRGTPFFGRAEVLDALAYLILSERDAFKSVERIANVGGYDKHGHSVKRFLGAAFLRDVEAARQHGENLLATLERAAGNKSGARDLISRIRELRALRASEGLAAVAWRIVAMLTPPVRVAGEADEDRVELITSFGAIAEGFESAADMAVFASACAEGLAIDEGETPATVNRVTIGTIHAVKGLEYRNVYLAASLGQFPHVRSVTPKAIEEERRLFYVAVTRTKDNLILTSAEIDNRGRPCGFGRFVGEYAAKWIDQHEPDPTDGSDDPGFDEGTPGGPEHTEGTIGDGDGGYFAGIERLAMEFADDGDAGPVGGDEGADEGAPVAPLAEGLSHARTLVGALTPAAERATAGEPAATAGEGGRFVPVTAASFADLLGTLGAREGADRNQRVWRWTVATGPAWTIDLRVYTTIAPNATVCRDVAEDSIRVAAVLVERDGSTRAILPKEAWICRTRGWRVTLLDRLDSTLAALAEDAASPCRDCGCLTRERTGKFGAFRGCIRFARHGGPAARQLGSVHDRNADENEGVER